MLNLINERLKQIKGTSALFGGVHLIAIGDLYQLKPVMDGWIFDIFEEKLWSISY